MRRAVRFSGVTLTLLLLWGCGARVDAGTPAGAVPDRVTTADGWSLSLWEYRAQGRRRGPPVLLVHGIGSSARSVDLDEHHSLPRWLAAHGRDAWVLSLRGTGDSDGPDPAKGRPYSYNFDTLAQEDLPAAIAHVRQVEHVPAIQYVGHSMGGMLLYAYLAQGGGGISAAVTLGSPTRLDWGTRTDALAVQLAHSALMPATRLPLAFAASVSSPLQGLLPSRPVELLLFNPQNTIPASYAKLEAVGSADISAGLLSQFSHFLETGAFGSADGRIDYRAALGRVHVPILVVAGKLDRIAPPPAVRDGYRALGGPKEWMLLSEEEGCAADYGHMDLVLGERAPTELWAPLLAFLNRHAVADRSLAGAFLLSDAHR